NGNNIEKRILEYVIDNMVDIALAISEEYDEDGLHFCGDQSFDVKRIDRDKDDVYRIEAEGKIDREYIANTQDGPDISGDSDKVCFEFFVNVDDNGQMSYSFHTDENGKIDFDNTFLDYNDFD
ncbi:MAG: hypothetical protein IJV15_16130, partial [Lachnospiraceae bacterium]|nr:hypothetical protein [Lachnospiraceae bacterium]